MQKFIKILSFCFCIIFYNITQAQCTVTVDVANLSHIDCPNGGAVGGANILTPHYYQNYSWQNITNGQYYPPTAGYGGTTRNDLDAGFYEITASSPYNSSCPAVIYSALFEVLEAKPDFQFNPTQACPSLCNVSVTASMQIAIPGVSYTYQFDANPIVPLPNSLTNQCGGIHTYEIFADGIGCGIENIGISQFAQMNLATSVTNATCTQPGSATVNITGVGASALNTYCLSGPYSPYNFHQYSTITNVNLIGDISAISNNTSCPNTEYSDFTSMSADVTAGNTYNLILDLGTCNLSGIPLTDIANVYVDWNIDGDFLDVNELVGQVSPTQSPSTHTIPITVPVGAIPGQSRMRIVAQNYQSQNSNQAEPCDYQSAWWGETEDYTIQVNGSVATPVTYLWSDGQTTQTATNLSSGTHTVTITDANGCSANASATISGSNNISVTASSDQTICNGYAPSSLNASSSGGAGTYTWADASNPSVILGTTSNFSPPPLTTTTAYIVTFTDASSGCTGVDVVVITVNSFSSFITSVSPTCFGDIDGSITIFTTGGNNAFQYTLWWMNPISGFWVQLAQTSSYISTSQLFPNLLAGDYWIQVDNQICPVNDEYFTLTEPPEVIITAAANQTICNGDTPAPLTSSASSSGSNYSWSPTNNFVNANVQNPSFSNGISNNTTYTVTFIDVDGCIANDDVIITVNPIPTVTLNASPNPVCVGNNITLTAIPSAGSTYRFQYNDGGGWTNLTSPAWSSVNPQTFLNIASTTDFRVKVRESNSCTASSWSPTIAVTANWLPSQTSATSQTACIGGVVPDLFAVGSLPTWYSDQVLTTQVYQGNYYATGQTVVGLYTYYVTETWNGCEGLAVPVTLEIYAIPSAPTATNDVACEGGVIPDLTATGTSLLWYDDAALTSQVGTGASFATTQTAAGVYTYFVTQDDGNCESNAQMVTLTIYALPPPPSSGNETACEGGIIPDLTATGTSLLWYDDAALTSQVGIGASFATMQTVAGVYTYYVTQNSANCESNAQMVTLEIYAIPVTPPIWHN